MFRHADVVCVHPVAVFNAAFFMTFSLWRMQEATVWKRHTPETI